MDISEMTVSEFKQLPHRKWDEHIEFDSMIILPAQTDWVELAKYKVRLLCHRALGTEAPDIWEIGHLHDSGYRCMDFVAVEGNEPICLLSGSSDVIHIDGIGGFGTTFRDAALSGWSIDCLPTSGLLRMFPRSRRMTCGCALSSFEIYALEPRKIKTGAG